MDVVNELDVDGQRFEYEVIGTGRPVVAVRNVAAPAGGWPTRSDVEALGDAGFSLVSYRHLGTTDTIEGIAADVGRFLDAIDVGPAALWGWSQGAMAAQELALARPDLVTGAVLMATRARLTSYDRVRYAVEDETDPSSDAGVLLQLMMSQAPDTLADDALFDAMFEAYRGPANDLFARANRAGRTYADRLDALRSVAVPCLVVAFSHDVNIPPALNREVADAIPGATYAEVAGAGHAGGVSHRHEVRELVLPFLERAFSRPRP